MTVKQNAKRYQDTVNLPNTAFPMQARGADREPSFQKLWEEQQVYRKTLERRRHSGQSFILHDGPPYLSSPQIHVGTALNKILKDIVVKYKTLQGYFAPYLPGYDSHGLPIENAALKKLKKSRHTLTPLDLRRLCHDFALENLKGQNANFQRLGILGEWEHPYITLDPKYEAAQVRVFGQMVEKGYIYKGLKPVHWCPHCETALAEAEVEYSDHLSPSIYVRFPVKTSLLHLVQALSEHKVPINFVIWTTTPWTLPANVALAVNPDLEYAFLRHRDDDAGGDEILIVAHDLLEDFSTVLGSGRQTVIARLKGRQLEGVQTQHPFIEERIPVVVLGDHVKADTGTGIVHTAPGHGMDDYRMGVKYNLPILAPVDDRGSFTEEAGRFAGMKVEMANEAIIQELKNQLMLVKEGTQVHSYPHCWRCKKPLLFRATEQWFASVDGFREQALQVIKTVQWIPPASEQRISSMVTERSDWCISRQRWWGVPIPAFYCQGCDQVLLTGQTVAAVADVFAREGSDAWWRYEAKDFLSPGTACSRCGGGKFRKESDIMDVWFDSGTSHTAVLTQYPDLRYPADMYLEGSDQHRGWFQSSLLTAVATRGSAPYRIVLTHGWTLDDQGRKMSKSLGNIVEPQQVIDRFGADVLRLWAASVDYTDDQRVSYKLIETQLAEVYRKIRNTARFLLGNLSDFNPARDGVPYQQLSECDRYALHRLQDVIAAITASFDRYAFYQFYQLLQNYAVVDLSNFYLDVAKDTLYILRPDDPARRSVQTVLFEILQALVRLLVPVLTHLAEDIWQHLPSHQRIPAVPSVLLTDWPPVHGEWQDEGLAEKWEMLRHCRDKVNWMLESTRRDKLIGSSLEARVTLELPSSEKELHAHLVSLGDWLPRFLIVSQCTLLPLGKKEHIAVDRALGRKCERCWVYSEAVGSFADHPTLCERCFPIISDNGRP